MPEKVSVIDIPMDKRANRWMDQRINGPTDWLTDWLTDRDQKSDRKVNLKTEKKNQFLKANKPVVISFHQSEGSLRDADAKFVLCNNLDFALIPRFCLKIKIWGIICLKKSNPIMKFTARHRNSGPIYNLNNPGLAYNEAQIWFFLYVSFFIFFSNSFFASFF